MACAGSVAEVRQILGGSAGCFTDDDINFALTRARCYVDACAFGDCAGYATSLVAAHILTLQKRSEQSGGAPTPAGPVTAESAGPLARSYGSATGSGTTSVTSNWFQSTPYGLEYLTLKERFGRNTFALIC